MSTAGIGNERVFVFLNQHRLSKELSYKWYIRRSSEHDREPIWEDQLTGRLFRLRKRQDKRGRNVLDLHILADEAYMLKVGYKTNFVRSLFGVLAKLESHALKRTLTLKLEESTQGHLFARIYQDGQRVEPSFAKLGELDAILIKLQGSLDED